MIPATSRLIKTLIVLLSLCFALPVLHAQAKEDLDDYKWRVTGMWWFSHPTGSLRASGDKVSVDLGEDFDFSNYSTFTGNVDWHFKRKHHFTFAASPVYSTKTATMTRDVTFEGVTYHTGATVTADLNSLTFSPGYQYDIIRRRQGYLGLAVSIHLLDTYAKLVGIGTVNNVSATRTASASDFAPLPVLGPTGRWYPIKDSNRFSLAGGFRGDVLLWLRKLHLLAGHSPTPALQGIGFQGRISARHQAQYSRNRRSPGLALDSNGTRRRTRSELVRRFGSVSNWVCGCYSRPNQSRHPVTQWELANRQFSKCATAHFFTLENRM